MIPTLRSAPPECTPGVDADRRHHDESPAQPHEALSTRSRLPRLAAEGDRR
jgi:hypothetical protein